MKESALKVRHPESENKIAAMFDRIAPKYDFLNRLLSFGQDQKWRAEMVKQVPISNQGRYLDAATGTAEVLLAVYDQHPEYVEFSGIDISDNMLDTAKEKSRGKAGIDFKNMSAEQLRFSDDHFDCITIAFGLRNVVNRRKALEEFARVLRPQGRLIILEFFIPKRGVRALFFQFYFHFVLPNIAGFFSDKDAYTYLPKSVASFYSENELSHNLKHLHLKLKKRKNYLFGGVRMLTYIKCGKGMGTVN